MASLRWVHFFGVLLGLLGVTALVGSRTIRKDQVDEFCQRQKEIQQSSHTDYME